MKIGIVTVYHTENCGSFLQAYAMQKALQKRGEEVYFLKGLVSTQKKYWYRLLQATKYVLKFNFRMARELTETYPIYRHLHRKFSVTETLDKMDLVIYGSDTIWNMEDGYFGKHWKRFFGHSVRDIPTGEIVKALLPEREDIVQVVDPTMLLDWSDYEEISVKCPEKEFVLVYYFGKMPEQMIQKIRTFANIGRRFYLRRAN